MGGPEEAELNRRIMGMMRSGMPVRNFAGKGSIKVAAAIAGQADLFVGNDAGLMHLATAMGTPTVAIFGLSNWKAWGPYVAGESKEQAVIVRLDLPCMPCFYRRHYFCSAEGCYAAGWLAMVGVQPVAGGARRLFRNSSSKT